MRAFVITLAGAIGGAALAVAIVLTLAQNGKLPINDLQMQTYLMQHPELAMAMMGRYQELDEAKQKAQQAAALRNQSAFFDPAIAFVTGPANAKNTLVEFYDYDCPYCRASVPAVQKYYNEHKTDTRFSLIEFPIAQLHGQSAILAAHASLAARKQPDRYMDFHFALLGQKGSVTQDMVFDVAAKAGMNVEKLKADMADPQIAKTLEASIALAHKTGVDGTPTFILNGKLRPGMMEGDAIAEAMKS